MIAPMAALTCCAGERQTQSTSKKKKDKTDRRTTASERYSDCPEGFADELHRRAPDSLHLKKKRQKGNGPRAPD